MGTKINTIVIFTYFILYFPASSMMNLALPIINPPAPPKPKKFQCELCTAIQLSSMFTSWKNLRKHIATSKRHSRAECIFICQANGKILYNTQPVSKS